MKKMLYAIGIFVLIAAAPTLSRLGAEESSSSEVKTWKMPGVEIKEVDWQRLEAIGSPESKEPSRAVLNGAPQVNHATAEADEVVEAGLQSVRVPLFRVKGWPEFKVENTQQCKKVWGRKICIDVPQAFERNCDLTAFAEISHPDADSIKAKIEECAKQAVAAGVLAGIYTGSLEAAAAALKTYLAACLQAQGVGALSQLSVTVRTESTCGDWKPR